jgi:penicillin-insensitive murein endopeptidase
MRWAQVVLVAGILLLGSTASAGKCPFRRPTKLARQGEGWLIPTTWAERGLNWGTPSMVGMIERVSRRVARGKGGTLYVADLSRKQGGASEWHRSHKCGRDVDLLFYALDSDGDQASPPSQMYAFDENGEAVVGGKTVRFDTARNWLLVKAIVQDRVQVQKIFVAAPLEKLLLDHARAQKESERLIAMASELMSQPSDSAPHDDHFHVRIGLEREDTVKPKTAKVVKPAKKLKPKPKKRVHARGRRHPR